MTMELVLVPILVLEVVMMGTGLATATTSNPTDCRFPDWTKAEMAPAVLQVLDGQVRVSTPPEVEKEGDVQ
jgi:hypothetical protein